MMKNVQRRVKRWFPLGLALGAALLSPPLHAEPVRHELTLGLTRSDYLSAIRVTTGHTLLEAAYHRPLAGEGVLGNVVLGGGLRAGRIPPMERLSVTVPVEGFVRLQFRARLGFWEALAGPEVGLSGFAHLPKRPPPLPEYGPSEQESARMSPVYLAMALAPAQLRFGRLLVSALEFHIGTSSWPLHSVVRYQVGFLRVGVAL